MFVSFIHNIEKSLKFSNAYIAVFLKLCLTIFFNDVKWIGCIIIVV